VNDTGSNSSRVTFSISDSTVTVQDTLGGGSFQLEVGRLSTVQPAMTDRFIFPVDDAVSFTTEKLRFRSQTTIRLRDECGEDLGSFSTTPRELPRGIYSLDITADIKIYLRVCNGAFSAAFVDGYHVDDEFSVTFDTPTDVVLGARSNHTFPEATITVPKSPEALASALPYLGSSIKEFSPERSWPSLRGYPPKIQHGPALRIPNCLSKPDTGVRITVEPSYADLYRIAPLAYYLGADIEFGSDPAIHLDLGYSEPLETATSQLTDTVSRILLKCFYLDTVTRIGGYYSLTRDEYPDVAEKLPFYPENLYELSLSEQLIEYLEVPFDTIEPSIPEWPLTATLQEGPDDMSLLPHLCNTLANVRVDTNQNGSDSSEHILPSVRSTTHGTTSTPTTGQTLLTPAAYRSALSYTAIEQSDFSAGFVFNNAGRAAPLEELFTTIPGRLSALLDDCWTIVTTPTVDQVQRILRSGVDFVYFDDPIVDGQVNCSDGTVDLSSVTDQLPSVVASIDNTELHRFTQLSAVGVLCGMLFTQPPEVIDLFAITVLLANGGSVSQTASLIGTPSRLFGDTTQQIVLPPDGRVPVQIDISPVKDSLFEVTTASPLTNYNSIGSVTICDPFFEEGTFQLMGTTASRTVTLSNEAIIDILSKEPNSTFADLPSYYPYEISVEFIEHAMATEQNDSLLLDSFND